MPRRSVTDATQIDHSDAEYALRELLGPPPETGDKRERLLRAAFTMIGVHGYESMSVAKIARAAGMSPGLVHYYFESKDDLLVAVADWCSHLFDGALDDLPVVEDGFELLRSRIERTQDLVRLLPAWYVVRGDLHGLARRLPAMREELARIEAEARERVAAVVGLAAERVDAAPQSYDVAAVAAALLGAFDGLAQQFLVDPAFDLGAAYHALAEAHVAHLRSAARHRPPSSKESP